MTVVSPPDHCAPHLAKPLARRRATSAWQISPGQNLLAAPHKLALSAPLAEAASGSSTVTNPSAGVGRPGRQIGYRHRDCLSRGYQGYDGAGCHAAVERSAGRAWPQCGGPAVPARAWPATPEDGSKRRPDRRSSATGVRQRLDTLFSVAATQWVAELDRSHATADHCQRGHVFDRQPNQNL
jgi:hypothetical protein